VYGKTDQTNPVQRRERGMEDERKSRRMRGWNGCTHKEGKRWDNDGREGGGCLGGWWRRQPGFTVLSEKASLIQNFTSGLM